ncbi:MAG: hypothetical protein KBB55_00050 [Candidatus Buchananbacteria bacterium]|nr:hypothetical protein [Candidatus Buchananbacteria bacterium]
MKILIYFMAWSKSLSNVFKVIFPFADFLYILQLEEYDSKRYLHWLPRFFWRRNFQRRDHVVYTQRIKSVLLVTIGLLLIVTLISWHFIGLGWIAVAAVSIIFIPAYILAANILLSPWYRYLKHVLFARAAAKIRNQGTDLKVIAVAGSYGKTTTKNFIDQLVRYHHRTQMIPGNINTPLGIAHWIMTKLQPGTTLLIVEIDGHSRREMIQSARMVTPDIAVITNIGDQHLERFGSVLKLKEALQEIFINAKPTADLICDSETAQQIPTLAVAGKKLQVLDINTEISYQGKSLAEIELSASNLINLQLALAVAEILNIPHHIVSDTIQQLELPGRRQKVSQMLGYEAIDDSYNISSTTARAGLAQARIIADAAHKKLLVITAGIPELGPQNLDGNIILGKELKSTADHIAVLGSVFAADLTTGIADETKFTQYTDYQTMATQLHEKFDPATWFLLVQPELGDLYY